VSERIYLDNATTTWPKPDSVYQFMTEFYRTLSVSPGRSGFEADEDDDIATNLRKRLTRFFGGDEDAPERLVFTYNATDSLNMIIQGLLNNGDHVVATSLEHNAVLRPINHLVRDRGVTATFVEADDRGFVRPDAIKGAIKENTRLVVVNHGSNVIGTIQPIREIGRVCRAAGIPLAIDSSQTAGAVPIDMHAMGIDILAFTGHKSLLGASGIGGLYVGKNVELRPTRFGGTGIRSEDPYHLEDYPWRLEAGTPNVVGLASLWAAQEWIAERGGVEAIHKQEMDLAQSLCDGLRQIDRVKLYCCDSLDDHLAVISMNIDGIESDRVGAILHRDFHIATRTGLHCAPLLHRQLGTERIGGTVRFGIGALNTEADISAAVDAVADIAGRASTSI